MIRNHATKRWIHFALFGWIAALLVAGLHHESHADDAESDAGQKATDFDVHVIGLYQPENSNVDDRVYVKIQNTGRPMTVVLCSYFGAQWNIDVAADAQLKEVIISGWFDHSWVGLPEKIPVRKIIGSSAASTPSNKDYFWSYAWHTDRGRDMQSKIKRLTGNSITTFQGVYEGKQFVIDGQAGSLDKNDDASGNDRDALNADQLQDRSLVEKHVRQLFAIDMRETERRIKTAEENLARIKKNYADRQRQSEKIINTRIAALMKSDEPSAVRPKKIADPTGEGWKLWRQQDWDSALEMFKIAVEQTPNDDNAWNGLGWTDQVLGKHDMAISAFERALDLNAKNGGAQNGLGRAYLGLGELEKAEKILSAATQQTIDEYGDAKAIKLGVTASWFGLVEVYLAQNNIEQAKVWADRYLKYKPDESQMKLLREMADRKN